MFVTEKACICTAHFLLLIYRCKYFLQCASSKRENVPQPAIVCVCVCFQLLAEDVDSPVNGAILYSVVSGDQDSQFFIDPLRGVIRVNKPLDRETVRARTLKHKYF